MLGNLKGEIARAIRVLGPDQGEMQNVLAQHRLHHQRRGRCPERVQPKPGKKPERRRALNELPARAAG